MDDSMTPDEQKGRGTGECFLGSGQQYLCLALLRDVKNSANENAVKTARIEANLQNLTSKLTTLTEGTPKSPSVHDRLTRIESLVETHIVEYENTKKMAHEAQRTKTTAMISLLVALVAALLRFIPEAFFEWLRRE